MKTFLTGALTAALLCGISFAQNPASPQPDGTAPQGQKNPVPQSPQMNSSQASTPQIAPGSVIPVQLTKTIDAKKIKSGDAVEAKVTQDMKSGNGEVIVAKDTKITGHITAAQARTKEQKESQVGIEFDHAVMKNGSDVTLPMSIQAVISQSALNGGSDNNGREAANQPAPASSAGGVPPGAGRPSGMGGGTASQPSSSASGDWPSTPQAEQKAQQPITGNTEGVVGISDLRLSTTSDKTQGSILTSEKNNVKVESGTLMLLRVTQ